MYKPFLKNPDPTQDEMRDANYRYKKDSCNFFPAIHVDEEWRPLIHELVKDFYYISSYGRIYSKVYDCIVRQRYMKDGYLIVSLAARAGKDINLFVHRLVLSTFSPIPNQDEMQVNHIQGYNKDDNKLDNLEWTTRLENMTHAYQTNLMRIGENRSTSVLTTPQAIKICEGLQMGYSYTDICYYAGIPADQRYRNMISSIKIRYSWKHISKDYNF